MSNASIVTNATIEANLDRPRPRRVLALADDATHRTFVDHVGGFVLHGLSSLLSYGSNNSDLATA